MPGEGRIFLGKFKEGACNCGIIFDKAAVKVTEA
jgi:hypothetical protein